MPRPSRTMTIARRGGGEVEAPSQVQVDAPADLASGGEERYSAGALIGEGGMGKVLLVRDRYIGREVALKQLKDDALADSEDRARFEREARLQGQLEHPAVVPVYDIGKRPDGSPFFTMKLVDGVSLADLLDDLRAGIKPRFSQRKLLSAFSQLCVAVHYAHERGVVHRDIKPANIMLGAYGEVYLLDWGVAKVGGDASRVGSRGSLPALEANLTGSGTVLGTLSTMAPEQALGGAVDARTDVYALGAVLFHILTGEALHPKGESDEVIAEILSGVEARPSVRCPSLEVAPELEELCVAATRLHAQDRLSSAAELHDAIEAYLDGDRDQELRRASAEKHSDAARQAADAILNASKGNARGPRQPGGGDDRGAAEEAARATALGEIGKALAFDPGNKKALGTLVELLTTPPAHMPKEVAAEDREMTRRRIRLGGLACVAVYGYISVNALATWQLGVRDVTTFATAHVLWACALVAGLVTMWKPSYVPLFIAFLFGITTCVFVTKVYSPYLIVPPLLTMHAVLFALVQHWQMRLVMVVIACLGWTASVFGESLGFLPNTVRFLNGDMLLHSSVIDLPEGRMTIYLYVVVLAMLVLPALVIGALRSAWLKSDRAMRLQVWQLRQLVAHDTERSEASARLSRPAPPSSRSA